MTVEQATERLELGYFTIKIDALRTDLVTGFDLYLPPQDGRQPVLYRESHLPFSEEVKARLRKNEIPELLVLKSERRAWLKYTEKVLPGVLSNPNVPVSERAALISPDNLLHGIQNQMKRIHRLAICAGVLAGAFFGKPAAAEPAENLLFITFDGLRLQELFGGADGRLMTSEAKAHGNSVELRDTYLLDTPEARREKLLPFFWQEIAVKGQVYGHVESGSASVVTNGKNFSYPGYNEILTGAADDRVDSNAKKFNPNVTVLEWLNSQPAYAGSVAAFGSWDVFPYIINTERSGLPVNAGWMPLTVSNDPEHLAFLNQLQAETPHYWAGIRFDSFTYYGAVEYIKAKQPRVLYVAFGETDDWAHDGRYDMYLDSARRTDDYIRRLWELLQSMPQYQGKTALLMTTDHGRGDTKDDWTGHGADIAGCERIWFALYGAGVPAKGIVKGVETTQSQAATTAAHLLGLDFQGENTKAAAPIAP